MLSLALHLHYIAKYVNETLHNMLEIDREKCAKVCLLNC